MPKHVGIATLFGANQVQDINAALITQSSGFTRNFDITEYRNADGSVCGMTKYDYNDTLTLEAIVKATSTALAAADLDELLGTNTGLERIAITSSSSAQLDGNYALVGPVGVTEQNTSEARISIGLKRVEDDNATAAIT